MSSNTTSGGADLPVEGKNAVVAYFKGDAEVEVRVRRVKGVGGGASFR